MKIKMINIRFSAAKAADELMDLLPTAIIVFTFLAVILTAVFLPA